MSSATLNVALVPLSERDSRLEKQAAETQMLTRTAVINGRTRTRLPGDLQTRIMVLTLVASDPIII